MSLPRHFSFTVNDDGRSMRVEREFDAPLDLVWSAWTTAELLDQWWAPKPYKTITKSMDFREGGQWLYYMLSPEGETHWCLNNYITIQPQHEFTSLDAFCNEEGEINMDFPRANWHASFAPSGERTLVTIVTTYEKKEDLEAVLTMGMQEGFTMALNNLDEVLATLQ
jgi:uncharacterized protein YndB with AHSA1/START domain